VIGVVVLPEWPPVTTEKEADVYKTAVPETVATLRPRFPLDVIVNFKLSTVKKVPGLIRPLVTEIGPVGPVAPVLP
jgi:hypothetical protein